MKNSQSRKAWSIDADAPLQSVLDSPECPPLLRQMLTGALSWQARNEMPVRRTLTAPRVAPQWTAALLALGATVTVGADDGPAEISLETLLQRRAKGKVSALHIPLLPPSPPKLGGAEARPPAILHVPHRLSPSPPKLGGTEGGQGGIRWGEAHVARTPADEPIVAAVAVVEVDDSTVHQARVALTGAWPEPARLAQAAAQLVGGPLDEEHIRAVAEAVEEEVAPRGDFRGSEEYRRAMAGVLTRRALAECLHQETEDE